MKKCPECGREYDNSMMFCLDDGAELLYGPATSEFAAAAGDPPRDEPRTAILHDTAPPSEVATRGQIHTTARTEVVRSTGGGGSKSKRLDKRLLIAPVALAVIVLGGFIGYRYFARASQIESIAVMPFVNESGNADVEYL